MEKVKIDFYGIERLIKALHANMLDSLDDCENYEEVIVQCRKDIQYLNTLKDGIEITTMAEYINLLTRLDELADGEYKIYNCGTLIELCPN